MQKKRFIMIVVFITAILVTAVATYGVTMRLMNKGEVYLREEEYDALMQYYEVKQAREIAAEHYAAPLEEAQLELLQQGAVTGMMQSLKDGCSAYYTEEEYKAYIDKGESGSNIAEGLLLQIQESTGYPVVQRVFGETAGYEVGITAGQVILSIDGRDMQYEELEIVLGSIRGAEGTEVSILCSDGSKQETYTLLRTGAAAQLVYTDIINEQVGYISIAEFSGDCAAQLEEALASIKKEKVQAVVIDLRSVVSGNMDAAAECADLLLEEGLIATAVNRGEESKRWGSDAEMATDMKIGVLTDARTAGVGEVFAAAIQGNDRGIVVGEHTRGQAASSAIFRIPSSGSAVRLATAFYHDPAGECIHGIGVTPDVVLSAADSSVEANQTLLAEVAAALMAAAE